MNPTAALNKWKWLKTKSFRSDKTASHLLHMAARWQKFFLGVPPLSAVGAPDVKLYEESLVAKGLSASALNKERLYLRQFFRWAREHGWIEHDPSMNWRYRPERVQKEYAPLSREDEKKLLAASSQWLKKYILFSIHTGLRQGTIMDLEWRHVTGTSNGPVLCVPQELMKAGRSLRLPLSRVARDCRTAVMGNKLLDLPPTSSEIYRAFKKAVKKSGINPLTTPHDLRRTWVQRMNEAGATLQQTMALGAWKSPGTLLKHYFTPVRDAVALELLEKIS